MKKDTRIIQTLMDTDRYKFSMQKTFLHHYPGAYARYRFRCRTSGVNLGRYADEIRDQIRALDSLSFSKPELEYMSKIPSLADGGYIDFLRIFRLNSDYVTVEPRGTELWIEVGGPLIHVMPFEIYILSIVSEVWNRNEYPDRGYDEARRRLKSKVELLRSTAGLEDFRYADFGGRRRESRGWHEETVAYQREQAAPYFAGTSNMWLAMKYGLTPVGTMAHEYLQAFQALGPRLRDSQKAALECWVQEFRGDLGVALTDVITTDAFLRDIDLYFAKLFDGFRQDSGDPVEWTDKIVARMKELRIDSRSKTGTYSNSLDFKEAFDIYFKVRDRIRPYFGIGTWLTNDFENQALNLVMKMVECNGQPVAKISDDRGKGLCDNENYVRNLMEVFQVQ